MTDPTHTYPLRDHGPNARKAASLAEHARQQAARCGCPFMAAFAAELAAHAEAVQAMKNAAPRVLRVIEGGME